MRTVIVVGERVFHPAEDEWVLFPWDPHAEGKIRNGVETKLILSRGAGCFQVRNRPNYMQVSPYNLD